MRLATNFEAPELPDGTTRAESTSTPSRLFTG
jgi:hypothetical protein